MTRLTMRDAALVLALAALPAVASSQTQTLYTTQQSAVYNTEDFVHGHTTGMSSLNSGGYSYFPLLQFDLSALAGNTVTGDGTFHFYFSSTFHDFPVTYPHDLNLVATPWSEATVTYSSIGGSAGVLGAILDNEVISYSGSQFYATFVVPQAVLQGWIDSPVGNFGLALNNLGVQSQTAPPNNPTGHADTYWSADAQHPAYLEFETTTTTPEPASFILVASGLAAVAAARRGLRRAA